MDYSILADIYEKLEAVSSKLKKTEILAELFKSTPTSELPKIVLLIQGRVFPSYSEYELGVAEQMMMRAIALATGFKTEKVEEKFKKTGDLGLAVEECIKSKRQSSFAKKKVTVDDVFGNLQKLATITGSGSQEKKLKLITELLVSAKPKEARYIVRTILQDLRVGAGEGILRDAIASAFLTGDKAADAIEYALNLLPDFGEIARIAKEEGVDGLENVRVRIGKPLHVMLSEKAESIKEVLDKHGEVIAEWKYDGMRVIIEKRGKDIWLFTRRLENVTKQFPDIVELAREHLKPYQCIVDGEAVGIDKKTGNPLPFQMLSQRVQRKYDIEKMVKEIPIQVNLFDVICVESEMLISKSLAERKKTLEKIVAQVPGKFQFAKQIVSSDENQLKEFYEEALKARQEGLMLKVPQSHYVFGRHTDGWYKIKPTMENLDLAIIGATWGEGARASWLTSYVLGARDTKTGNFVEVGMMSTGLTEKEYEQMTKTLQPLIVEEKGRTVRVRPKVVVEVKYQEIQKSPTYGSGFALRFPALSRLRPDKGPDEVDTIERVKKLYESQGRAG
ncbi:ATP-dependent DNA ligase [archaeon]|nr:MAG: ATP-dependent DNA ligase [archaeon]